MIPDLDCRVAKNAPRNDMRRVFSPVSTALVILVRIYQITISPFLGRHCRFHPSCSRFMTEAIELAGWKGVLIGLRRIGRCHPFHPGGYDPVENWIPRAKP